MQFSAVAVVALATSVAAWHNVTYTTEVVTAYTTYCPEATALTFNGQTYTVTDSTTLTITNCPCTVVKPVTTSTAVSYNSSASSGPVYSNSTVTAATTAGSVGTSPVKGPAPPTIVPASSANKAVALSGASLAGLLGLAAYIL